MASKKINKDEKGTKPKSAKITAPKEKLSKGRPTTFTAELAKRICLELAEGKSLRRICRENECYPPESTVRQWVVDDVQGFYAQYTRARDIGLDAMADEILDICDTPQEGVIVTDKVGGKEVKTADMIEHRRLRVDTRKWYLSKMAPKRYDKPVAEEKPKDDSIPEDYKLNPDEGIPNAPIL